LEKSCNVLKLLVQIRHFIRLKHQSLTEVLHYSVQMFQNLLLSGMLLKILLLVIYLITKVFRHLHSVQTIGIRGKIFWNILEFKKPLVEADGFLKILRGWPDVALFLDYVFRGVAPTGDWRFRCP
jgi:hypothetical protein